MSDTWHAETLLHACPRHVILKNETKIQNTTKTQEHEESNTLLQKKERTFIFWIIRMQLKINKYPYFWFVC